MSYLSESGPSYKSLSKRSYVAVAAFNANIFSYTTSVDANFNNVGTLAVLSTATAGNCPKGRILRENGRKLYPGANPGITAYMVGVYDAESLLSGFIDPNSPLFAVYNSDKPYYVSARRDPVSGGLVDNSAPVYTNGSVEAGTTITAGGQLKSSTLTTLTTQTLSSGSATVNIVIDPTLGQVFTQTFTLTGGTNSFTISTAATPDVGSVVYLILKTSGTHTTAANVAKGSNVVMQTVALGTVASKTFGITLVSDGTNLVQVGGDIIATAM